MLLKRAQKLAVQAWLNRLHEWTMHEMADGKILVLFFTCCQIIKSYRFIKLAQSNLIRLYFTEKNNWGANGKIFERSDW